MTRFFLTSIVLFSAQAFGQPHSLTVGEGFENPLGYHDATPAFSWKLPDGVKTQTAYQVEVDGLWDSGWVESDQSVLVGYAGGELSSRERAEWRVRFRDQDGRESAWSEKAEFELGLLENGDWSASWIRPQDGFDGETEQVAWLKRRFEVPAGVSQARLYVTARGLFRMRLNGARVGDDCFANGWTPYLDRIDTLTYDVTSQLKPGENEILAMLGTGWYSGRLCWNKKKQYFGEKPELLAQLEMVLADGSVKTVVTDGEWSGTFQGPIVSSSIYDGEHVDARRELGGWGPVAANPELGEAVLVPKPFAVVRETGELVPVAITEPEPGRFVFDLGQNMVGWERLRIPMVKDGTVTVRFAEMLNQDGTLYTENYRSAKSTDSVTAAATGVVEWEPVFTFHGFRYVELSGFPAGTKPEKDWVTGVVLHSDLTATGSFESSHAKLNRLQKNIVWGQRGNFLDIPTDCPQRDERLGWTGDAQVFCPTAMFNYDCHAFWKSWLGSMRLDQLPDGRVPHVIPSVFAAGSPGWQDAATIIPWEAYVRTGDEEFLTENLEMMEKLVGWYRGQAKGHRIEKITAFGDWLQPYSKRQKGDTPEALIGTAFYAHSAALIAKSARVLGMEDKAKRYEAESAAVKQAFVAHYLDADGKLTNALETQTGYLLALEFELVPDAMRGKLAGHLVRLIGEADGHLRTGFLGTPYIASVLDEMGHTDLAYALLFKETYPSWFYSINQGATTMWERWNSYSHDKGFGNAGMNSFNHYAYGAIGQWMYERVAGLAPDPEHPGYKHFFVRPTPGGPLDKAGVELDTPYGKAASRWQIADGKLVMDVVVPANTTATVEVPDGREAVRVSAGKHRFEADWKAR